MSCKRELNPHVAWLRLQFVSLVCAKQHLRWGHQGVNWWFQVCVCVFSTENEWQSCFLMCYFIAKQFMCILLFHLHWVKEFQLHGGCRKLFIFFADSSSVLKRLRTCANDTLELNCSSMLPQCCFRTLGFHWNPDFCCAVGGKKIKQCRGFHGQTCWKLETVIPLLRQFV